MTELALEVACRGFAVIPQLLASDRLAEAIAAVERAGTPGQDRAVRRRGTSTYSIRNLLGISPAIRALAGDPPLVAAIEPVLGTTAYAVRATLFDKNPDANWALAFHQDLTVAVRERIDLPGWDRWSVKAGVPHVQPPAEILAGMLAVRIHLDDCGPDNGALRVLPGSHRRGRLTDEQIDALRETIPEVVCSVPAGGGLLMRPLLLHASSAAVAPRHRRVIHIEYAGAPLPGGLEWFG